MHPALREHSGWPRIRPRGSASHDSAGASIVADPIVQVGRRSAGDRLRGIAMAGADRGRRLLRRQRARPRPFGPEGKAIVGTPGVRRSRLGEGTSEQRAGVRQVRTPVFWESRSRHGRRLLDFAHVSRRRMLPRESGHSARRRRLPCCLCTDPPREVAETGAVAWMGKSRRARSECPVACETQHCASKGVVR
jgi:hypothetical protein